MMKIILICVGSIKNTELKTIALSYYKRLGHFCSIEIMECVDGKFLKMKDRLEEEKVKIEKIIDSKSSVVVVLDEKGKQRNSIQFSNWIEKKKIDSTKYLYFIIGSSHGLSPSLKDKYSLISLSSMTLTHEWARVFLLEQLYRSMTIMNGIPYHH